MWCYQNGTYEVLIEDDGTKHRFGDVFVPQYPESIDVKVTNACDAACPFCHEDSHPDGASFRLRDAIVLFRELPPGVELAIGGGNPLLVSRELSDLSALLPHLICNLTVNARHLPDFPDYLRPTAIGISYVPELHDEIRSFMEKRDNCVVHLIAGVHSLDDMERCLDFPRLLVMGYKKKGRGLAHYSKDVEFRLREWEMCIGKYVSRTTIAFDNLALEQLDVRRFFSAENWGEMYMGADGQYSMYIDLVQYQFGPSSTSPIRIPIQGTVEEMFGAARAMGAR